MIEPYVTLISLLPVVSITYIKYLIKLFLMMKIWMMVKSTKQTSYIWDSKRRFYQSSF